MVSRAVDCKWADDHSRVRKCTNPESGAERPGPTYCRCLCEFGPREPSTHPKTHATGRLKRYGCVNRGGLTGSVKAPCCGGSVGKYECTVHGECVLSDVDPHEPIQKCSDCDRFVPRPQVRDP